MRFACFRPGYSSTSNYPYCAPDITVVRTIFYNLSYDVSPSRQLADALRVTQQSQINFVPYLLGLIEGLRLLPNSFYFLGGAYTRRKGPRGGLGALLVLHF